MSNIKYKVFLDNDTKGKQQITEPVGMKDLQIRLERNIEDGFFGLIQLFAKQKLGFFGDAKDYLQSVLDTDGIDGEARIDIDISDDGGVTFSDYFDGVVDFDGIERVDDEKDGLIINARINESGFYQKLKSRMDVKVDLFQNKDFSGGTRETINKHTVTTHNQSIRKKWKGLKNDGAIAASLSMLAAGDIFYCTPDFPDVTVDELDKTSGSGALLNDVVSTNALYEVQDFTASGKAHTFKIGRASSINEFGVAISGGAVNITSVTIRWFYQVNSDTAVGIGATTSATPNAATYDTGGLPLTVSDFDLTLKSGDIFRMYLQINITTAADTTKTVTVNFKDQGVTALLGVDIEITVDTTFPTFDIDTYLVHEAGNKITNSITEVNGSFKSNYLGTKISAIQTYTANGCGAFCAITSGLNLRGNAVTDKPMSMSFKEYFDGLNAIWNLGLDIESTPLVRIEEKKFFFGTGSPSVTLLGVNGLSRTLDTSIIDNAVKVGYSKWKSETFDSADDFATIREYANRLKTVGKKKNILSGLIAGTYAIENTRRMKFNTKDGKLDDDAFIIALKRTVDGSSNPNALGTPEKDENFSSISGLLFSDESYNLRLSAGRNFLRWGNMVSAGLLEYAGTEWLIQSGEGNLDLISIQDGDSCEGDFNGMYFDEGGNINWDYAALDEQKPLFKPFRWKFDIPLPKADFDTIVADKRNTIEVETFGGVLKEMFIWSLKYIAERPLAEFECIEANI